MYLAAAIYLAENITITWKLLVNSLTWFNSLNDDEVSNIYESYQV